MKSNHRLIRSLERGHRDKESLERFAVQTKQEGKRLSSVLLALNLPSYLDQLYDEEQELKPHPLVLTTTDRLMELLAPLMQALSEYRIVCGRGNIRGTEGPRNAVATGLLLSYIGSTQEG